MQAMSLTNFKHEFDLKCVNVSFTPLPSALFLPIGESKTKASLANKAGCGHPSEVFCIVSRLDASTRRGSLCSPHDSSPFILKPAVLLESFERRPPPPPLVPTGSRVVCDSRAGGQEGTRERPPLLRLRPPPVLE